MNSFVPGSQAIFSRNWSHYLEAALKRSKATPEQVTVFQSNIRWVSGKAAVPCQIYFGAIPEDGSDPSNKVEYVADLVEVRVDPTSRDAEWLKRNALPETRREGLWGQTLYAIKNCRKVRAFPLRELRRVLAADRPLSDAYTRSYSLVRERK